KKAKSTANQAASNADKAAQEAQKQANQEAAKANQAAQQAQQEAQKQAKQAAAKVQQDVEAAKTAALQAKREVEKTTRRVASRVRQEGNKAQDMVGGFLAPPPTPPTLPRGKFFNLFDHNRTGHAYINSYLLGLTSLYVYEPDLVLCPKGHDCWRQWKQAFTQLFSAGGMTAFHFIKEPFTNTQAAVMSNDTLVVVVFRGSEQNSQDWGQIDAQFPLIPAPNWGTGVMTHRGFTAAFRSVFPGIRDAIRAQNKTGSKRVWLTGHSLGGALAFLHAHALVREAGFQIQGVHTYGAPRVGNPRWNRVYSPPLGAKTQRWVNNADFVTLLVHPVGNQPQQLLRYQHVGQINNIYADRTIRLNDNERSFPPTKYSTNDHNLLGYIWPMVSHLSPTERSQLPQLEACD
ncbi:MAG: lipase family protein, partial [Nitrospirales bacterium]